MPKSREVSIERRAQVLALHEAGNLMRTIFLQLRIPRSIEQEIINRFRNTRNYRSRHLLGRRRVPFRHVDKNCDFCLTFGGGDVGGFVDISASSICPYDEKLFGAYLKGVSNGNFWCYGIC